MAINPPSISALAAGLLVSGACGGVVGWKLRDADYQRHLKQDAAAAAKATTKALEHRDRGEAISQSTREEKSRVDAQTRIVYQTIEKEVPRLVTETKIEKVVVAGGGLPAGFVWTFNNAASNSSAPFPTGTDRDAPTGVDLSDLARTTAGNFELYHHCAAEVAAWHDWYNRLKAEWPTPLPPSTKKD